jgi:hypothetical protein
MLDTCCEWSLMCVQHAPRPHVQRSCARDALDPQLKDRPCVLNRENMPSLCVHSARLLVNYEHSTSLAGSTGPSPPCMFALHGSSEVALGLKTRTVNWTRNAVRAPTGKCRPGWENPKCQNVEQNVTRNPKIPENARGTGPGDDHIRFAGD